MPRGGDVHDIAVSLRNMDRGRRRTPGRPEIQRIITALDGGQRCSEIAPTVSRQRLQMRDVDFAVGYICGWMFGEDDWRLS